MVAGIETRLVCQAGQEEHLVAHVQLATDVLRRLQYARQDEASDVIFENGVEHGWRGQSSGFRSSRRLSLIFHVAVRPQMAIVRAADEKFAARNLDFLASTAAGEELERHFHTVLCPVRWFSERSKNYCETGTTTKLFLKANRASSVPWT